MAIYTVDNTARIGKPVNVFSADGTEIKDCVYADTESGRVVQIERDLSGKTVLTACGTDASRIETIYPLPLRVAEKSMFKSGE